MCSLVCHFFPLFFPDTFSVCLFSGWAWRLAGCWCETSGWKFRPLNVKNRQSCPCSASGSNKIDLQSQQKGSLQSHSELELGGIIEMLLPGARLRWMCAVSKLKCKVESDKFPFVGAAGPGWKLEASDLSVPAVENKRSCLLVHTSASGQHVYSVLRLPWLWRGYS